MTEQERTLKIQRETLKVELKHKEYLLQDIGTEIESIQKQIDKLMHKLNNLELDERMKKVDKCHEELKNFIHSLGYSFKGGNNSIYLFGEISAEKNFLKDSFRISFGAIDNEKELNLNDDPIAIEQIRKIIKKYDIKLIQFNFKKTNPFCFCPTYSIVTYDNKSKRDIQPKP